VFTLGIPEAVIDRADELIAREILPIAFGWLLSTASAVAWAYWRCRALRRYQAL